MEGVAMNWVLKVEGPLSLSCCLYPFVSPCSVSPKGRVSSQPLSYFVANRVVMLQVR